MPYLQILSRVTIITLVQKYAVNIICKKNLFAEVLYVQLQELYQVHILKANKGPSLLQIGHSHGQHLLKSLHPFPPSWETHYNNWHLTDLMCFLSFLGNCFQIVKAW